MHISKTKTSKDAKEFEELSMPLSNTALKYYDSNILRLSKEKRSEYHGQVDRLVTALKKSLVENKELKITKIVKAGSFAKHTILKKTNTDPVDVDVVIHFSDKNAEVETLNSLNDKIYPVLVQLYPSKSVEDFTIQRKASTVYFIGSGLSVDVVPVVEDTEKSGYGWQYDINDGTKTHTCATCQIKFIRDRKNIDPDFRTLVRLAKKWRNHSELKPLKSFTIELIMAYLLDKNGNSGSIEKRFRDFLLYLAQYKLSEVISFPENGTDLPKFNDPVVIIDPVCNSNNVASRISEDERMSIVNAATTAWEIASEASSEPYEEAIEIWKEIFGPRFKVED